MAFKRKWLDIPKHPANLSSSAGFLKAEKIDEMIILFEKL